MTINTTSYFNKEYGITQYETDAIWVSGQAFFGDKYYNGESLANLFLGSSFSSYDMFREKIKLLNGNFAVVMRNGDICFAAVDRIRSIPLFYSVNDGNFYISNDAKWLKENHGENSADKLSFDEFYCAGYVTGKDTLLTGIKQLRAGECLMYDARRKNERLKIERHYNYTADNLFDESESSLPEKLDEALKSAFKRLITSARGRTLVVPLSGGLDSRLLAAMLKKTGYNNVVCFSYGRRGNHESQKSKYVADKLGFKWIFVEYSLSKWRKWRKSKEFGRYFNFADNFVSLPHIDDWAAVEEMKYSKLIPEDSIFVPGHTGDFISGGHLNYIFDLCDTPAKNDLIGGIIEKHYGLWPERLKNKDAASGIYKKVRGLLPEKIDSAQEIASNYEYWEWQERQAKFIVNSVRVYDFWGFEWRLPFWDQEIMDFWKNVPYGLKLNKKLYIEYLTCFDTYGLFEPLHQKNTRIKIMNSVKKRHYNFIARKALSFYENYKKLKEYVNGPKAAYGMYGVSTLFFNLTKIRNPNSLLVRDYLDSFINAIKNNRGLR